jgi:uncharacterized membrane protein YfcA
MTHIPFDVFSSILLCCVALLAGFTQGLSGFGSVLVALPILALFLDFNLAVPLVSLWGMTINIILLVQLRTHLRLRSVLPLTIAAIPGIPLGVYILKNADVRILEMFLGGLLVVFSLYFAWSGGKTRDLSPGWAYFAGFWSGCLGGSLAMSGPPVIIYTALQPWSKDQIKSTLTGFFFLSGLIIIAAQTMGGLVTTHVLTGSLVSIPFIILGVFLGSSIYHKIETNRYRQVVVGLITLLGVLTVIKALGG